MDLKERKTQIESELKIKLENFQRLENTRNQLSSEIIELRGKLALIEELLKEETEKK